MPDGDIFYRSTPYHFRRSSRILFMLEDVELAADEAVKALGRQLDEWQNEGFSNAIDAIVDADQSSDIHTARRHVQIALNDPDCEIHRKLRGVLVDVANSKLAFKQLSERNLSLVQDAEIAREEIAVEVMRAFVLRQVATTSLRAKFDGQEKFNGILREFEERMLSSPQMAAIARNLLGERKKSTSRIPELRSIRSVPDQEELIKIAIG